MSGTGRSLQDIYDAGSKRLDELEQAQRTQFETAGSKSVEALGNIESSVMQRMEQSLQDLDNEVRTYLDKALEGINSAVNSEVEENKKFLARVQEALKLSASSLTQDVHQLKESLQARINSSSENNLLLQKRHHEQSLGALKADGALFAAQLKEKSQESVRRFESENSGIVMSVLDKNINLPSEFFAEFSKNVSMIDAKLNECLETLSERGKQISSEVSNDTTEIQASLDTSLQHIQGLMDQSFQEADAALRGQCEQSLATALQHQEAMAQNLAKELQESPQLSSKGVAEKLAAMRVDTDNLLEQVKQLIGDVDIGVRSNATKLTEDFEHNLQERMEGAREHHKVVAEERAQLMERIAGDLREIESGFQTRLSELAQNCLGKLSTICVDAELAIVAAHDACAAEFKNVSSAHQKSIEEKTEALVHEIERLSVQAIQAIKAAAGDTSEAGADTRGMELTDGNNPFGDLRL
ncbi:MAG: hypothetical protein K2X77_13310 [Candidatus Obscuribacterales bacterium]|jgi:DNA anti-recombination protein RmuC|nr:hypothetical protein [Candidatus Obscuribacterales bacterium]